MFNHERPRSPRVEIMTGEGRFEAELRIGEFEDLQATTGLGPLALLLRLESHGWHISDVRNVLGYGFTGAGMNPIQARELSERLVKPAYLMVYVPAALAILEAGIYGKPDIDEVDETPGELQPPTGMTTPDN